ncbi:MAG: hypothetical protein K6F67_02775 [Oscillospiraceae bacterium]|nr:hypothetical protein [Oscillospiraceae bacterium]
MVAKPRKGLPIAAFILFVYSLLMTVITIFIQEPIKIFYNSPEATLEYTSIPIYSIIVYLVYAILSLIWIRTLSKDNTNNENNKTGRTIVILIIILSVVVFPLLNAGVTIIISQYKGMAALASASIVDNMVSTLTIIPNAVAIVFLFLSLGSQIKKNRGNELSYYQEDGLTKESKNRQRVSFILYAAAAIATIISIILQALFKKFFTSDQDVLACFSLPIERIISLGIAFVLSLVYLIVLTASRSLKVRKTIGLISVISMLAISFILSYYLGVYIQNTISHKWGVIAMASYSTIQQVVLMLTNPLSKPAWLFMLLSVGRLFGKSPLVDIAKDR